MKRLVSVTIIAIISICGSQASAQFIGLFGDPDCGSCSIEAPPSVGTTAYISLATGGAVTGLTGADFKVTGLPVGWIAVAVPNIASDTATGDPFSVDGASIGFSNCQSDGCIMLYTVTIIPMSSATDVTLTIETKSSLQTTFGCPTITLCDGPSPTTVCVSGGQGFINSSTNCTVGVETRTWSEIKNLYQ